MNDKVRITVSGIRGKVPDALNVSIASKFASAFSSFLEKGKILICHDSRNTSPMLAMSVFAALSASGLEGWNYGLLPTPFLQFIIQKQKSIGGISITGGHNPLPWNAILLLNEKGQYIETSEGAEIFNIYESGIFQKAPWNKLGTIKQKIFSMHSYLSKLGSFLDLKKIRDRNFKLTVDPCNGALSPFLKEFADFLDISLSVINNHPEIPFPHPPEPNINNASQAEAVVNATESDLGCLFNSDGSRVSLVDNNGNALSEEFTFPLILLSMKEQIDKAVTTLSTSSLADWAAEKAGITLFKTKVGQSAVMDMIESIEAQAGGEGSGSFALSDFSHGYDACFSMAVILDLLARKNTTLVEIVSQFPVYFQKKINYTVPPEKIYTIMDQLEKFYSSENADLTDGIRIDRKGVWMHVRPSMTEFTLRVIIEGHKKSVVAQMEKEIENWIRQ